MVQVRFTRNIQRHVACPPRQVPWSEGLTVRVRWTRYGAITRAARGYFLDDQGVVRRHVVIFLNGEPVRDRTHLAEPVNDGAAIDVMQALSGG